MDSQLDRCFSCDDRRLFINPDVRHPPSLTRSCYWFYSYSVSRFSRWALNNNNNTTPSFFFFFEPGILAGALLYTPAIHPPDLCFILRYLLNTTHRLGLPCVCHSGTNKFACNHHKLLELLHGNKLVRTESDNTTHSMLACHCCCCYVFILVVIVIRIHVERADIWMATVFFLFPIHVLLQYRLGKEQRTLRHRTTIRNYEFSNFTGEITRLWETMETTMPIHILVIIITAVSIDTFQLEHNLQEQFHGEINEEMDNREW